MKKDSMEKSSVLRMINGAIEERVDYEVGRLIENVMDRNTKPNQKRKITITLEFVPDETRTILHLNAVVKSVLAPTDSVKTTLSQAFLMYEIEKKLEEIQLHAVGFINCTMKGCIEYCIDNTIYKITLEEG